MSVSKSQDQSSQDIVARYTATELDQPADTSPGSVNRDLINPVGNLTSNSYTAIENVRLLASLQNAALITDNALSQIGLTFDLVQLGATKATGVVYFQRTTLPTTAIDFPAGTVVMTRPSSSGTPTKFVTTAAAQLSSATTLNPTNRRYEVSAPIVAVVSGSIGNVGMGTINTLDPVNRNIDAVVNKESTTGGSDVESNEDYAARLLIKTAGSSLGTPSGYASALQTQFPSLTAVSVAGPNDSAMIRNQYGNEIDVYLLGTSNSVFTDVLTATGAATENLTSKPTYSITSVTGVTNSTTYVVGTDVALTRDESRVFGNSTLSFDKLTWLANRPGAGQTFSVSGVFDATVAAVQDYLTSDDVRFVTADIVAKAAFRVGIVVRANAVALAGYDRTALQSSAQSALMDGISNYSMGQSITQSDIIELVGSVAGIDEVAIPLTEFRKSTEVSGTVSDQIEVDKSSYPRVDTVVITVV